VTFVIKRHDKRCKGSGTELMAYSHGGSIKKQHDVPLYTMLHNEAG